MTQPMQSRIKAAHLQIKELIRTKHPTEAIKEVDKIFERLLSGLASEYEPKTDATFADEANDEGI